MKERRKRKGWVQMSLEKQGGEEDRGENGGENGALKVGATGRESGKDGEKHGYSEIVCIEMETESITTVTIP
ncbi:hypothetical protein ACH5RR_017763 [Cinchona calisaya]|uniref:Uncharacterized protein n=1 Tax=Cinchona calisaya TaxID=153742 RepID=A0ABD2ZJI3_9GENT